MASTVTLKAAGLNTSPNRLLLPDGAMTEAHNVVIKDSNVVEPRRGQKLFGTAFGSVTDRAKQIFEYRDRIFRHFGTTLQFQDGTTNSGIVNFTSFSEPLVEVQAGLRIKKVESNGNLYITSVEGIKKISASTGSGLSSAQITEAGGIKALDMTASLVINYGDQTSFLPQDSAVAYRIVWATKDANNNLILGTPSQREEVYNPMSNLISRDFAALLRGLDGVSTYSTPSLINDGDYVSSLILPDNATAVELQTNLIAVAEKIDKDIVYADSALGPLVVSGATISGGICTITFSSGDPTQYLQAGSKILISGFTPASGTLDGAQTLTTVTTTTIAFLTTATGAVTLSSEKIQSNTYRSITQPVVPGIPTANQELVDLQEYLQAIIILLQAEPTAGSPPTIDSAAKVEWIDGLTITTNAYARLTITIPENVTTNYFYQIYRSSIVQATGGASLVDLIPSDELQLVYEAYPTQAEILARELSIDDITPDEFRGANLYTNPSTGEGILQANDLPPFAKDVNRYKNTVFYANTKTRNRLQIALLGVEKIIEDVDNALDPTISIISGTNEFDLKFVKGVKEVSQVVCNDASTLASSGTASYFLLNSANDAKEYYVWYARGTATDPAIANKTGIVIQVDSDLAAVVAQKTADIITSYSFDFVADNVGATVTITNSTAGNCTDISAGTSGFAVSVTTQGQGENPSLQEVLLSDEPSVAIAVDQTARSIVRVINQNTLAPVNAFYLSASGDVPGKILLESKSLSQDTFYVIGNTANLGLSFNPDISFDFEISSIASGVSPVITTSSNHGLSNGDEVVLSLTDSSPTVNGVYKVFNVSPTTFQIEDATVVTPGTAGFGIKETNSVFSDNEEKINRVYYSKLNQPEAVPLVNYFDVGDSDKEILRIFPLRDSLFVFKEEGLYRISGEVAPFTLALFDSSCQLFAPDSLDVSNNVLYCLTTQGISTITEGGIGLISIPILNDFNKIRTFTNADILSFGVGYESDNSYTIYTVSQNDLEWPDVGYRFGTQTGSWTTVGLNVSCGFVNSTDNKLYFGAADTNYLTQERKDFSRTDFADREYTNSIVDGAYMPSFVRFSNLTNVIPGNVITQIQYLTIYEYNMLLQKLDMDSGINDNTYYSLLQAVPGVNLRSKLLSLCQKLDADLGVSDTDYESNIQSKTGSITSITAATLPIITTSGNHGLLTGRYVNLSGTNCTPSLDGSWEVTVTGPTTFTVNRSVSLPGTVGSFSTNDQSFEDIKGCYNQTMLKLNADSGVSFSNYKPVDTETLFEVVIDSVDKIQKRAYPNLSLQFVSGPVTIYDYIPTSITYAPNSMGDTVSYKHLRESTIMFENKNFTKATLGFATDLLPAIQRSEFNGDGNGIFGHNQFGEGFFGGVSHAAPHRTYIPRPCQRCIYVVVQFQHKIARETYRIFNVSVTGENTGSSRSYRR